MITHANPHFPSSFGEPQSLATGLYLKKVEKESSRSARWVLTSFLLHPQWRLSLVRGHELFLRAVLLPICLSSTVISLLINFLHPPKSVSVSHKSPDHASFSLGCAARPCLKTRKKRKSMSKKRGCWHPREAERENTDNGCSS